MSDRYYLFTSESVTEGHPDKVCDQISDAVVDAVLAQDPSGHVACETLVTQGQVVVAGEVTFNGTPLNVEGLVRGVLASIGYDPATGFDGATIPILNLIHEQSRDINQGVECGGAGDQGMMFGFACLETPQLMPAPIQWSHDLAKKLAEVRKSGQLDYLRPDGKTQVTVAYNGHHPVRIDKVVVASHHAAEVSDEQVKRDLEAMVVRPVLEPMGMMDEQTQVIVNRTGRFVIGGPVGDTGVTGRKIIVDTYGGMARHGGGAFSGKDSTKVDRSAAYMMRYIAKNLVAAGIAERVELEIAYVIADEKPMGIYVDTYGTGKIPESAIRELVAAHFDLSPNGIIKHLDLRRPQFLPTAAYGHFGRTDLDVRWEHVDIAKTLAREAGTEPAVPLG
jgi:S-adenosylmethionine synthetase